MAKAPKQHREPWTKNQVAELKKLVKGNTPTPLLAYKMDRTEAAIERRRAISSCR